MGFLGDFAASLSLRRSRCCAGILKANARAIGISQSIRWTHALKTLKIDSRSTCRSRSSVHIPGLVEEGWYLAIVNGEPSDTRGVRTREGRRMDKRGIKSPVAIWLKSIDGPPSSPPFSSLISLHYRDFLATSRLHFRCVVAAVAPAY